MRREESLQWLELEDCRHWLQETYMDPNISRKNNFRFKILKLFVPPMSLYSFLGQILTTSNSSPFDKYLLIWLVTYWCVYLTHPLAKCGLCYCKTLHTTWWPATGHEKCLHKMLPTLVIRQGRTVEVNVKMGLQLPALWHVTSLCHGLCWKSYQNTFAAIVAVWIFACHSRHVRFHGL